MKKIMVFLLLLAAASLSVPAPALAANGSWGIFFHKNGEAPAGDASAEYLAQFDAAFHGDLSQKVLYLTFDAGYENGYTAGILDTLKKHEVNAAFFLVGHYMKSSPDLVRRMCEEGHTVGNHTYRHPDMTKMTDIGAFRKELEDLEALYRDVTGREMARFYRPPEGRFNEENLKMAKQLGYKTVFWSLAYRDWLRDKQPDRREALDRLLPRAHPGAVILLHSTSQTNAEILDELLTRWKAEGYRFGRLEELFPA